MSTLPTKFLPGQNYDCIQCGRGCTNPWNITVEQSCIDALVGSELKQRVESQYGPAFKFDEARQVHVLNRKPNGHCVFLQDSPDSPGCLNCSIHAQLGYAAKPATCKGFPFIVVETPDDIRVGASFYCRAVQQNVGRPLEAHASALDDFGPAQRLQAGHRPFQVFDDVYIDWEGYKVLVQFLQTPQVGESRETLFSRALLGLARTIIKSPANTPLDAWMLMDDLQNSTDQLEKAEWFRTQMESSLHGITIFIECETPEQTQALAPSIFGEGTVKLPSCGWEGPVQDLLTFRATPLPPKLQMIVDRYLDGVLFRHYLATHGPLLQALIALYLNPALIRQYARLIAGAAGETVSQNSVFAAIDRCEHDLMLHGKGFERLWGAFANALLAQIANS